MSTVTSCPPSSGCLPWRLPGTWASARESCVRSSAWLSSTSHIFVRSGMNTSDVKPGERVKDVRVTEDALSVDLMDGRTITVPLAWYPRLLHATPEQLANWQVSGGGFGIHWPDLDEDLSTEGL